MDQNNASPAGTPPAKGPVMDVQAPKPNTPAPAKTQAPQSAGKALKNPKKGKTPVGVILVALLVAISLGALTVFAYMKTKDSAPVKPAQQTEQKASAQDVDNTTQGIDESLKAADDAADFNDSELSDTNLGL